MANYRRKSWRSEMAVRVDVNGAFDVIAGEHGLTTADLEALAPRLAAIHADLEARRDAHAFRRLPVDRAATQEIVSLARDIRAEFDTLVVLGIGGSSLGTRALISGLRPPFQVCHAESDEGARIIVADNPDPRTCAAVLDEVDLHRTAFNVVSKSGRTAETVSQFLVVRERLLKVLGAVDYRRHVVMTTDAEEGPLRQIVNDEGFRSLAIPAAARGHLSVLSAVGLFPAAVAGIDVPAVLAGAESMDERCRNLSPLENPAVLHAAVHYLAQSSRGRSVQVVMPYADALQGFAAWAGQVWSERLAKSTDREGRRVLTGQTTVAALGATDQHSLLQNLLEGPDDKIVTFLRVENPRPRLEVPHGYADLEDVSYLGGRTLGELLNLEQRATEALLAGAGRMSTTLVVPEVNAFTMGQLFYLVGLQTLVAAELHGLGPEELGRVEEGKRLASAVAGRKGLEERRAEVETWLRKKDPRFVV